MVVLGGKLVYYERGVPVVLTLKYMSLKYEPSPEPLHISVK
jgi:hypothetical protein